MSVQNILTSRFISRNIKLKIYKTMIVPVVAYGCEYWSLPVKKEHRLKESENRMIRKMFGPKMDETTGE